MSGDDHGDTTRAREAAHWVAIVLLCALIVGTWSAATIWASS